MNKALEEVAELRKILTETGIYASSIPLKIQFGQMLDTIETELKKVDILSNQLEHERKIRIRQEKKLKVLDIIKDKRVNTDYFWRVLREFKVHKGKVRVWGIIWTDPLEYYNEHLFYRSMDDPEVSKYLKKKYYLTKEEFDLLKEYLC